MLQSLQMGNKHISKNPDPKRDEPLVEDILKVAFRLSGIEIESAVLLRWRIVDDIILAHPLITLGDLFREFGDGNYQLAISNAVLSGIEKESFGIPNINVEVAYINGQWSELRAYTDFEEFGPEYATQQALHGRLERVKENLRGVLELIPLLARIAESVRELFS